jgi:hypothetical protein
MDVMKVFLLAGVVVLMPIRTFAQPPRPQGVAVPDAGLLTSTGHEVSVSLGHYGYVEPGAQRVSIHGPKLGAGYTGTFPLNSRRHWFGRAGVRGMLGSATYDGFCSPWEIRPNSASPNGYELDLGDASACSDTGDRDWYVETRALAGKDFIGGRWAMSPYAGIGFRHLSNGTAGVPGFRTDDYLYPPLGATARTSAGSRGVLSLNLEYDRLIRGWQNTRTSKLGGGPVPPTATAPGFTIDGFSDTSFAQHGGWALRASATYPVTRRWSVEPYLVHWSVGGSSPNDETATFTVNGVTAHEQLGFYEPPNTTSEFGVRLGLHFGGSR